MLLSKQLELPLSSLENFFHIKATLSRFWTLNLVVCTFPRHVKAPLPLAQRPQLDRCGTFAREHVCLVSFSVVYDVCFWPHWRLGHYDYMENIGKIVSSVVVVVVVVFKAVVCLPMRTCNHSYIE